MPLVKTHLEALAKKKAAGTEKPITEPKPPGPPPPRPPPPDAETLVAIVMPASKPQLAPLRNELEREAVLWAAAQRDQTTVRFAVIAYSVKVDNKVPMARARVQVKIGDSECGAKGRPICKFDRVMRTDTIVGDTDAPAEQLAARTAREVLAILRPHLRRAMEH